MFVTYANIRHMQANGKTLRTTAEHPFFVYGKGWMKCSALQPGDELRSHNGRRVFVERVYDSGVQENVYNCRVEEHHTYFVGMRDWDFSVWAHNTYQPTVNADRSPVTRAQRWLDLASQTFSFLPKQVKNFILRSGGKGVAEIFGLELAHLPKRSNAQGFDYSEALPSWIADHRGIQHRYLRERATGTTIGIPQSGTMGSGPLSLPPPGALP